MPIGLPEPSSDNCRFGHHLRPAQSVHRQTLDHGSAVLPQKPPTVRDERDIDRFLGFIDLVAAGAFHGDENAIAAVFGSSGVAATWQQKGGKKRAAA
jgi:hypothetical protein